jgi:class 3 adenylate cyclase
MSWDYEQSMQRVQQHLDGMGDIEVERLVREMNLENLSETVCRQIYGAHVYCEIRNLSAMLGSLTADDDRKRLIQAVHIYQREVNRIVDAVGGVRIHFQGSRVHVLIYRPIRDAEEIATKAVLLQVILARFGVIFSDEFAALPDLDLRNGSDIGEAIGTRNGVQGDRELLFLGSPANHAAKLLEFGSARRVTAAVRDALPADLTPLLEADPGGDYRLVSVAKSELADLLMRYEVDWDEDASLQRLKDDRDLFPQIKAEMSGAETAIAFDELSFFNSKVVEGASLFGDVSGFTAYIDGAATTSDQKEALRVFHAIRLEMARVVKDDFDGVRVQFQGDRVQALFHLPEDDAPGFCDEAVRAAVGSSPASSSS